MGGEGGLRREVEGEGAPDRAECMLAGGGGGAGVGVVIVVGGWGACVLSEH